ncbi:response regulator [Hippea alviniae]|uniref:response regulator n=1 Tax=Hippea alviniae TaxID=1279027 RepID=UPI0003B60E6F|nr:response regulator [Hippea alviniae]
MEKKKALIVCEEVIINELVEFMLEKLSYDAEVVDNPKDAVSKIESEKYDVVIVGKNKGTIVKPKLADILYTKAISKPYIIIYKEPGEIIPQEPYLAILPKPTFHQDLIDALDKAGLKPSLPLQATKIDINDFVKSNAYYLKPIHEFFRGLKGNIKFSIKTGDLKVVGFTMGTDFYLIYSDLENPYSLLSIGTVNVATEPLNLNEFLNFPIDSNTFKINIRDFIVKSIENIDDRAKLLSFLPEESAVIVVKAPAYILKQIELIDKNIDVDELIERNKDITFGDILSDKNDTAKIRAVACMYLLNMIDGDISISKKKYDVKIKKSFLKKIIEKIRGL